MSSLIQIQNVSKNFDGAAIVQNFDLEVRPGEVVSLIGPSVRQINVAAAVIGLGAQLQWQTADR